MCFSDEKEGVIGLYVGVSAVVVDLIDEEWKA